ncbi:non-ribosomal peptide synthetase, partial [Actinoplanes regularis]|uniref:non-ribosomal peptide synthetase n=1 Tax=Actinoplanes regularis TaxID=52697 RepID=UPI0025556DBB
SVPADVSFFELGGDSLSAMRLIARIRRVFDAELSIGELFTAPSAVEVAGLVSAPAVVETRIALTARERPQLLPLSYGQQRMWFLNRIEDTGQGGVYNMPMVLRISGDLDVAALEAALGDVADRHEILRTVYPENDGIAFQQILQGEAARPPFSAVPICDGEPAAFVDRRFDLSTELPWRVRLFVLAPGEFVLAIVAHHIALDGWSIGVLRRDLRAAYTARRQGQAPTWTDLGVQYADYALWQRDVLGHLDDESSLAAGQLRYWRKALAGVPQELTLLTDRPRPAVATFRGGSVPVRLDAQTHADLLELGQSRNATLFMVVHAAVAVLLTRMGAGSDISIGSVVAGRGDAVLEDLLGFFVNTLVLRTDLSGNPTFAEVLDRVCETDLAAYANQDVPFERLVEELNPARSLALNPLFQIMCTLENAAQSEMSLPGTHLEPVPLAEAAARVDLSFELSECRDAAGEPAGLTGRIRFAKDLFDESTVLLLAERLASVLRQVAADARVPLSRVDVTGDQRALVVEAWNDTARPVSERSAVESIAARVAEVPDEIAVTGSAGSLTYRQLWQASTRVAGALAAHGVTRGQRIGLVMERSVDLLPILLGVWRSGAAYVPVDPQWPLARAEFVLRRTDLVVGDRDLPGIDVVAVETLLTGPDGPVVRPAAADLAYVMYTSGSTGTPKGVEISHGSVAALVQDSCWSAAARGRVLLHAPHAFDASIYELWVPLVSGGRVVVAEPSRMDAETLAGLVRTHELTAVHVTAGMFGVLADVSPDCFGGLGEVLTGGDVVPVGAVSRVMAAEPGLRVTHLYGPTEATLCATAHAIEPGAEVPGVLPIGGPRDNTRVFVLDEFLMPAPVGVLGELYISGSGLARGYADDAGLTAGRFVACPLGTGERMYRTGDLARWDTAGRLYFAGRADEQVKIRGFRIEPAEIQAVLTAHPQVSQAAVIAREDRPGDKRLVAYLVADGDVLEVPAVREFAAQRLPEYALPTLILLDVLPVTANGKLDRAALPAPDFGPPGGRAAETATEELLCGLFAEILGVPSVPVDVPFFELGGDSLSAMRLVARIRAVFETDINVRGLFTHPTVAGVAELVHGSEGAARPALEARPRPESLPLSYGQQRMWFLNRIEDAGQSVAYNMPMVLRISGDLDVAALEAALGDVADRHEVLRTVYPDADGAAYQRIVEGAAGRPSLQVTQVAGSDVTAELTAYLEQGFDLGVELPWRARLLVTEAGEFVLAIVAHHIALDGWSMGVLTRDLRAAYTARRQGQAPTWTELDVQYADYALWQREVLGDLDDESSLIAEQLAFWRETLSGAPQELVLPTDRPRPAVASMRGATVNVRAGAETHARLVELAQRSGSTVFMVAHAALAVLLSRMGAGIDIPLGTSVAGRGDAALDDLVGFFINTLVLRTDLSGDPSFTELLARVRETDLAAYANQEVPFERLVDELSPVRSLARNPLFQVMFVVQNLPQNQDGWSLPGVLVRPEDHDPVHAAAKFDLSVILVEHHDERGRPAGFTTEILYATDLFDESTAQSLANRLVAVLGQVAADPQLTLSQVDVLTGAERDLVTREWNDTTVPVAAASVPELIQRWVAATPDAVAVRDGDGRLLTYGQLDEWSQGVAFGLRSAGVNRGDRVGLCLPRSVEMVAAMLGVWRVGAAFVPLDPQLPVARREFMTVDSGTSLVLSAWDSAWESGAEVPAVVVDGRDLAYVIYTSGSTGVPKGVAVAHAGVASLAQVMAPVLDVSAGTAALQFASFSFDASVLDVVTVLGAGGTLVIADDEQRRDMAALSRLVRDANVRVASVVPSLLAALDPAQVAGIRRWVLGAEFLSADLASRWSAGSQVWNTYGPTEATVITTAAPVLLPVAGAGPSMGRPIGNARVLVLDEFLQPVPVGVVGEVYIGGLGLARGYVNRPGLTAHRFVADPSGVGGRLYRSGDLARWDSEGLLHFAGRSDDQVKIRGFRIEPAEVQAVLEQHPQVAQAAVIARDNQLIGYLVAAGDELDVAAVREFA